jgi:hypothetical protein
MMQLLGVELVLTFPNLKKLTHFSKILIFEHVIQGDLRSEVKENAGHRQHHQTSTQI